MAPTAPVAAASSAGSHAAAVRPKRAKWADDGIVAPVEFALAQETETFDRAFRLVHDQYVSRDYMAPDPSGRRINLRHALPSSRVFVAKSWPHVVGTVTLFRDSALGLPMDDLYKEELDVLRARGRQVVEASHLATDPENRMVGLAVLMRMFRMMLLYAAEFASLDDLCLVVNPRHAEFYEKFFECRPFGAIKYYDKVNGAPAVPLRLDLHHVRGLIADARSGRAGNHEIRAFLYEPTVVQATLQQLQRDIPRSSLTCEQFAYFFEGSAALQAAAPEQRAFVQSLHSDLPTLSQSLSSVLSQWDLLNPARYFRPVFCAA
jgi:hypothetical protein